MENNGFDNQSHDEILLDPDKLAKILYSEDNSYFNEENKSVAHDEDYAKNGDNPSDGMYTCVRDSDDYESLTSDLTNKIHKVLPATDQGDIDEETDEKHLYSIREAAAANRYKLPPVTLQKVQSEDLSWLDTIIKHNSLDMDNDHLQDINLG